LINKDTIKSQRERRELALGRLFKGAQEEYKIYMALGILELEGLIKWTGSKRPVEYAMTVPIEKIEEWCKNKIKSSSLHISDY
jgi:hypothetical protein